MVQEVYCSYDIAKLLSEKDFILINPEHYYAKGKLTKHNCVNYDIVNTLDNIVITCTHQCAIKWLREEKHLYINIIAEGCGSNISYYIEIKDGNILYPLRNSDSMTTIYKDRCSTYEDACELAIRQCLKIV